MDSVSKHAGEICLDFANTLSWHASEHPVETLSNYDDLVTWARKYDVLSPREADQLLKEAQADENESSRVYERGIQLREAIYRIIVGYLHGHAPAAEDLKRLNYEFELAHHALHLAFAGDAYQLAWTEKNGHLDRPLWHIARSVVELLTSRGLLARVGQCADDRGCGWLYIDWSKNHSRRWCDINDCGNRAKQRRYYQRGRRAQEARKL